MDNETLLELIERGGEMIVSDKFQRVLMESQRAPELRSSVIYAIGKALGRKMDSITFPANWERFLRRKDCPTYMKKLIDVSVNVYYPKLPLPEEEHWITFESPVNHTEPEKNG